MHGLEVESGRKWCGLASSWALTTWSFSPGKALQGFNRERERVVAREFYLKNPTPPGAAQAT